MLKLIDKILSFFLDNILELKKKGQLVKDKELLTIQDREDNCIESGLVYYCREMPAGLLSNLCTKLEIVNRAQGTVEGFIPYHQGKLSLFHHI